MEIKYIPEDHEYFMDGVLVDSVTQIMEKAGLTDLSNVPPYVLKRASTFGINVHEMIRLFTLDDLDIGSLDSGLMADYAGWRKFLQQTQWKAIDTEEIVCSEKYRFAGRYDQKGLYNDKLTLLEIKTAGRTKDNIDNAGIQLAGYGIAHDEDKKVKDKIKQRISVWLDASGNYKVEPHTNKNDEAVFKAAITIVNHKRG